MSDHQAGRAGERDHHRRPPQGHLRHRARCSRASSPSRCRATPVTAPTPSSPTPSGCSAGSGSSESCTGEDVGSPVSVRVDRRALPITAWAPAGGTDGADIAAGPDRHGGRGRPARCSTSSSSTCRADRARPALAGPRPAPQLAQMLRRGGTRPTPPRCSLDACPLDARARPDRSRRTPRSRRATRLLLALDGARSRRCGGRHAARRPATPAWVTGAADPDGRGCGRMVGLAGWRAPVRRRRAAAWTTTRLEHRFLLRFGHGDDAVVVRATAFGPGSARWHHFEWLDGATSSSTATPTSPRGRGGERRDAGDAACAIPGMPADRYWQLEDGDVDVSRDRGPAPRPGSPLPGRVRARQRRRLAGDPRRRPSRRGQPGPGGAGDRHVRRDSPSTRPAPDRRTRGFRMFEVTAQAGTRRSPAGGAAADRGDARCSASRSRRSRSSATRPPTWAGRSSGSSRAAAATRACGRPSRRPPRPTAARGSRSERRWSTSCRTQVPHHWIPLVPIRTAPGIVGPAQGRDARNDGEPVLAASLLLEPTPLTFPAEEIPREGITVRAGSGAGPAARRQLRPVDRAPHRSGRGEGNSGFASDTARPAGRTGLR